MLTTLGPLSFFGEMALLHPEGRSVASVRVDTYCEGYHLSVASYLDLTATHPTIRDHIESVAKLRLRKRALETHEIRKSMAGDATFDSLVDALHLGESRHEKIRREVHAKHELSHHANALAAESSVAPHSASHADGEAPSSLSSPDKVVAPAMSDPGSSSQPPTNSLDA